MNGDSSRRNKKQDFFDRVKQRKKELEDLPSAVLRERLALGHLHKEAAIAMREILTERGELDSNSDWIDNLNGVCLFCAVILRGPAWRPATSGRGGVVAAEKASS